ncbi:aminoacyl-tRNA hydrolase [Candidatus Parcubacteria bacterium]|nr:aminoacyl-tRNA hydrolase [Candidatus Parcubacteria bacterium]
MYTIAGLGNPGEEFKDTRHNTGRQAQDYLMKDCPKGVQFIELDTYMNKSGSGVLKFVKSKKAAEKLVVIYDDLDLPIGTIKMSWNRSSGGHKGVESIIKALKTESFIRIRIGISPTTPSGKIKKPLGESQVEKHILGKFNTKEKEVLKKVFKRMRDAVETLVSDGLQAAMGVANQK